MISIVWYPQLSAVALATIHSLTQLSRTIVSLSSSISLLETIYFSSSGKTSVSREDHFFLPPPLLIPEAPEGGQSPLKAWPGDSMTVERAETGLWGESGAVSLGVTLRTDQGILGLKVT